MPEPALRFLPLGIDLAKEEKALVEKIHAALDRLTRRRKGHLPVSSSVLEDVLREALLYRVVATASGTIVNWNAGNVLCSFFAARGLFETFAFLWDYRRALTAAREMGTLEEFEALTQKRIAGTRNPKWIQAHPEWEATNILTAINRLSNEYSGVRDAYDVLSYRCHPNSEGMFYTFANLDEDQELVHFSDHNENTGWAFRLVIAVAGLTINAEQTFDWLEEEVPKIGAKLKDRRFKNEIARAERERLEFENFVKEEKKALQGDAGGQFNIGTIYTTGFAMAAKNVVLAHMWFSLSAVQGNEEAAKSRDKIAQSMTASQIAEARTLVDEWKPLSPEQIAEAEKYWSEWRPKASDQS